MEWQQFSFEVRRAAADEAEQALQACGALSVTFRDAGDDPVLEPAVGSSPLWESVSVDALFEGGADGATVRTRVEQLLGTPLPDWSIRTIEDRAWERAWMDDFHPMRFGHRLWVVPTGVEPPDPAAVNLRFDPGLAFGTGTHPTTALCLEWLDSHPPVDETVIDYGCGSGVLAVAALALGARAAVGVDNDPQALVAARDNAARNGVASALAVRGVDEPLPPPASLVVANILSGILIDLAPVLTACTRPGGTLILSGVLDHQADEVRAAFGPGFRFVEQTERDEWVRLVAVREAEG